MTNHPDAAPHRLIKALGAESIGDYEGRFFEHCGVGRIVCPGDPSIGLELHIRRRGYGAKPDELEIFVGLAERSPPNYPGNSLEFGGQRRPETIRIDGRRDPISMAKDVRRRLIDNPQTLAWARAGINAYREHRQALDMTHRAAEQMCEALDANFDETFTTAARSPRENRVLPFYLHGLHYTAGNLSSDAEGNARVNITRLDPMPLEKAIRIIRILQDKE